MLAVLPVVMLLAWLLVVYRVPAYYQASLSSVLVAASRVGEPGYMFDPPEIEIVERERGSY